LERLSESSKVFDELNPIIFIL